MKNDIHIAMMKKANALIKSVNKEFDELYQKHKLAEKKLKKSA